MIKVLTFLMGFLGFLHTTLWAAEATEKNALKDNTMAETKVTPEVSPPALLHHGLGLGVGQTLLFGDFADHGDADLS